MFPSYQTVPLATPPKAPKEEPSSTPVPMMKKVAVAAMVGTAFVLGFAASGGATEGGANSSVIYSPLGIKTEGQKCFSSQGPQNLCIEGLYCYKSGTTTVNENSGGAFCCPEGLAPTNVGTCGQRGPPGPVTVSDPGPATGSNPGPATGSDPGPVPGAWSVPMQGGSFDAPPGYFPPTICSTCAPDGVYNWPGGCIDAHVGTCTSGPLEKQGLKAGLEGVCKVGGPGPSGTMSMGHAAYSEQKCGECVCIMCDDQSVGGCKIKTSFLHMRTDNENFALPGATSATSVEFTEKFFKERWSTNGEQRKTFYRYKKVAGCDPSLCV